jgi:hypothetical protein
MNPTKFQLLICFVLLICASCSTRTQEAESDQKEKVEALDFEALADLLIDRMDLQEGENILLVGLPGRFDPLISGLAERINNSPASYLGAISISDQQPESWSSDYTNASRDLNDAELQDYLKQVDIGIMLPGATPIDRVYGLIQDNLDEGEGRTIHFHWAGAYDLNGETLEISPAIDQFYQEVLFKTDYQKLAANQLTFENEMRGKKITVTTPAGTNISFEIGDRPVTKQSGDASAATAMMARNLIDREMELPAGAIRVAPIEETVNGQVAFPDANWGKTMVTGLILSFEKGKVTNMSAESGMEAVQQVMEQAGESAKSFREFALGMNPRLAIPEENAWIPYYGYGSGIVRLSLGDNTELGGNVSGGFVRWNFFTDATVVVGDDVWVENGKLIK